MINAFYEPFPTKIQADGKEYSIITDFREWFRFADMTAEKGIPDKEKIMMMTSWLNDIPERITENLIFAICGFYRAEDLEFVREHDEDNQEEDIVQTPPVLDWKIDASAIIGDFLRFYRIDLLTAEMHWWKFKLLLSALPDDSQIMKRIAYRSVNTSEIKNENERKRIMRMKQIYALPFEMDDNAIGAAFGLL